MRRVFLAGLLASLICFPAAAGDGSDKKGKSRGCSDRYTDQSSGGSKDNKDNRDRDKKDNRDDKDHSKGDDDCDHHRQISPSRPDHD